MVKINHPADLRLIPLKATLERFHEFQSKPKSIKELKNVVQSVWDEQPQDLGHQGSELNFIRRLRACVEAGGGHLEHVV